MVDIDISKSMIIYIVHGVYELTNIAGPAPPNVGNGLDLVLSGTSELYISAAFPEQLVDYMGLDYPIYIYIYVSMYVYVNVYVNVHVYVYVYIGDYRNP